MRHSNTQASARPGIGRRLKIFLFPAAALLTLIAALAQQTPPKNPAQNTPPASTEPAKFTATSQLVVENVTVKDKSGKVIEGLTAKDFLITEDNVPQNIRFCMFQRLLDTTDAPPVNPSPSELGGAAVPSVTRTAIAPEKPGDVRYKDRRLLALYFDMTAMPVPDQLRALAAGQSFIKKQMNPADIMAIMEYDGGSVKVLQDFTDSRDLLMATLEKLIVGEGQGFDPTTADESAADTGSAFGQDDSEFNIFNTDRQLAALQTAVKMLEPLNEKKSLVYFASGLRLSGVDNQAQMQATVNSAIRANVSFFPIDSRGLVAQAPMGDATHGSPGGVGMYSGASTMAFTNNFQRSQDTLYTLAADTGGKALLDYNDLTKGIVQAEEAIGNYYIIGYYSSNEKLDGKYRRIKISLTGDLAGNLTYRQGYYGGKVFNKFTTADKERQLEEALMLGDPITELTIQMEVDYFQLNRAEYFVPVSVKIPGRELVLAKKGGAEHTLIDFIGEVKDEYNVTVQNMREKMDIKLKDATAAQLATTPIQYDTGFTLLPGSYTMKVLARDDETGRIGTYIHKFVIPNLNKEDKRVPISSVVLSSQRIDLKDAIYSAKDKLNAREYNPLVQDGQQLIPSVTRVFSKSRDMYVYLQAYERAATSTQPLVAFVSFYRGQTKAFETPPLPVTEGLDPKSKAVPLKFSFSLDKLQAGTYDCQVTVVDPNGNKAAFWQAPIKLVQ